MEEDMAEDRHLWHLGMDGRLLYVIYMLPITSEEVSWKIVRIFK